MFLLNKYGQGEIDPAFTTVVHLAHLDGADGYTGLLVNSCPRGTPMNTNGGELDTALKVFGPSSLLRTSVVAAAPAAGAVAHADYQFATSDFTAEFWYRLPVMSANYNIFDMSNNLAGTGNRFLIYTYANGRIGYYANSVERIVSAAGAIVVNTWQAIAYSRVSGTGRLFVGGTQVGSSWSDTINYNASAAVVCGSNNGNAPNASWDEVRVSNGIFGAGAGRYSGNYTPAVAAFPDS